MGRIVQTLRYLEGRINAMIDIWGGAAETAPEDRQSTAPVRPASFDACDLTQSDVDSVIVHDDLFAGPGLRSEVRLALSAPPIDRPMLPEDDLAFIERPQPLDDVSPPSAPQDAPAPLRIEAFAEIDALDPREKLLRFT
jgi:hypothetical protein